MVPNVRLVSSTRCFRSSLVEMLAATASATCLPALALIALATSSQACCLREETTTFAPCSAICSAIARPMPREEPVMTATFPDISNKFMFFPPFSKRHSGTVGTTGPGISRFSDVQLHIVVRCCASPRNDGLSQLALYSNLRPRRLMHRLVRGIGHPRLLVHHWKPPVASGLAREVVEPGYRTIF